MVDHKLNFLSVDISESVYQDEMMDDDRNIVKGGKKELLIYLAKEDWSEIQVYEK